MKLASSAEAQELDRQASDSWGLPSHALVEAAGRLCAQKLIASFPALFAERIPRIAVLAGSGNNGADALVCLRALLCSRSADLSRSSVFLSRESPGSDRSPRGEAERSLTAMGVRVRVWTCSDCECPDDLAQADLIIDGISGTGLRGALSGTPLSMVQALDARSAEEIKHAHRPLVVSIDLPSGLSEAWRPGMALVRADATLAVEPIKKVLYLPMARMYAGAIFPVLGLYPPSLVDTLPGPDLCDFDGLSRTLPSISPDSYKHLRGVVEIWAGASSSSGAARLAGRGAQAAGAGLVRLVVDPAIRGTLAVSAGGVMVAVPEDVRREPDRFSPDAVLLGPGWGRGPDRAAVLDGFLGKAGPALILDADAILLAKGRKFSGNVVMTPHPGEMAAFLGIDKNELLADPDPILLAAAKKLRIVIVFKGHTIRIVSEDGRMTVVDGMAPILAMGGSGDVLAGLAAALIARCPTRLHDAAACAAALLIAAGRAAAAHSGFCDPLDVAAEAGRIAGAAWLPPLAAVPKEK